MANKHLFQNLRGAAATDTVNEAGGKAYQRGAREKLAQLVCTGTFSKTYYTSAETQLDAVLHACEQVDADFLAKLAVYARRDAFMKDAPALLCAVLASRDGELLEQVFDRVIDNTRMLRNFVQILRSGVTGRRSLGSRSKRLVRRWLAKRSDTQLFVGSVGQDPSLADVVKMVHPKPASPEREAFLGYLLGKDVTESRLPEVVRQLEAFKRFETDVVPDVPFQFLTSTGRLGATEWAQIARRAPWQMTRMNLNTFHRNRVFEDPEVLELVADRLRDRDAIRKAKVFPYQLMTAFYNMRGELPSTLRDALQDALEISLENVPEIPGQVYVAVDVSGSMSMPVTGYRTRGSYTKMRCFDVAALVGAAILRRNPGAEVLPFAETVRKTRVNSRDSIATNAQRLASHPGGGTNCSAPLAELNRRKARGEVVIFVSDNQSWVDSTDRRSTEMLREWDRFRARNATARLICIDLQPYETTQVMDRRDILNVGGFSDRVFDVIREFALGRFDAAHWVAQIEAVPI